MTNAMKTKYACMLTVYRTFCHIHVYLQRQTTNILKKKNKGKKHKMKLTVLSSLSRLFGTPLPIN